MFRGHSFGSNLNRNDDDDDDDDDYDDDDDDDDDDDGGGKTISFEVSKAAIIVSGNCEAHEATKLASAAKLNSAVLPHIYALHIYITNP